MKKFILLSIFSFILISCDKKQDSLATETSEEYNPATQEKSNIYSFIVKDIDGNDFDFSKLKGKKIMIVNTASKCGYTPQYEQLEEIYNRYKNNDFIIIGFPANNFKSQEPGSNKQIKQFCSEEYGVTFPMMSKISVKGDDMAPIYQFLTEKSKNGVLDSQVKWNFQKYLIGKDGTLDKVLDTNIEPNDSEIISWIEEK